MPGWECVSKVDEHGDNFGIMKNLAKFELNFDYIFIINITYLSHITCETDTDLTNPK